MEFTISAFRWLSFGAVAVVGFFAGVSDTVPVGLIVLVLVVGIWVSLVSWAWRLGEGE